MLNLFFVLSFLLQLPTSQTTKYTFDYKIEYDLIDYVDSSRNGKIINYINSKDNRYHISVYAKKNSEPVIRFLDYQGLIYINKTTQLEIDSNDFNFDASRFRKYKNPYIFRKDDYDFIVGADTVLQKNAYKKILLATNKHKLEQRKRLAKNLFIIDTNYNVQPLFVFSTAYEMWKVGKPFPNGVIIEKHLINYNNQIENSEIFKSLIKINLEFEVDGSL